jgi:glycosyltransferase involved in cell wall biosynthesis
MGSRILVVTPEVLASRMAGPAIRAVNIAAQLVADDRGHRVTLVSTASCEYTDERFECRHVDWPDLGAVTDAHDVLIVQGFATFHCPKLLRRDRVVIVDLYDPLHFEQLEQLREAGDAQRRATIDLTTRVLNEQCAFGDFFVCASETQRALWLGALAAMGRVNPVVYDTDVTLRRLIDIAPFGLPDAPAAQREHGIRGVVPGIDEGDQVIIWAGGVYDWFDPLTLVRAVGLLAANHPRLRLFFMGMAHPNPDVGVMSMADRVRALAADLGLTGTHVFFNEGWVDYERRADFLLDADIGVSTHFDHLETAFAFRTRMLDYLWSGLPIVATAGDEFARLVVDEGLGLVVPEADTGALASALARLLDDPDFAAVCRARSAAVRDRYAWSAALEPIVRFCRDPQPAPDRVLDQHRMVRRPVPGNRLIRDGARARELLAEGGLPLVVERARRRIDRLTRRR